MPREMRAISDSCFGDRLCFMRGRVVTRTSIPNWLPDPMDYNDLVRFVRNVAEISGGVPDNSNR